MRKVRSTSMTPLQKYILDLFARLDQDNASMLITIGHLFLKNQEEKEKSKRKPDSKNEEQKESTWEKGFCELVRKKMEETKRINEKR